MTTSETMQLLAPIIQPLIMFAAGLLALVVSGGLKRIQAWMNAHDMAAGASAIADANAAIQPALMTGATALAKAVQDGTLPTSGAAWEAALQHEMGLVKARVPQMLAVAQPLESALLASMAQKANAMLMASPAAAVAEPSTPVPLSPTEAVKQAGQTIADMRAVLAQVDGPTVVVKPAPVAPAVPAAPLLAPAAPAASSVQDGVIRSAMPAGPVAI